MGGLGGKGKGSRRRGQQQKEQQVFDRKNGEFVRNKAMKLPQAAGSQKEDNERLPRKLKMLLQRMGEGKGGKVNEAQLVGPLSSEVQAPKSRNKYKHLSAPPAVKSSDGSLWATPADMGLEPRSVAEEPKSELGEPEHELQGELKKKTKKNLSLSEMAAITPNKAARIETTEDPKREEPAKESTKPSKLKKKLRLAKLHERKKKKTVGAEELDEDWDEREHVVDNVAFGEVAQQPPALTLKRKRSAFERGGQILEPPSKGKKLGDLMARQMAAVQAQTGPSSQAPRVNKAKDNAGDAHERLRKQIIEQYRRKKGRMATLPEDALKKYSSASPLF